MLTCSLKVFLAAAPALLLPVRKISAASSAPDPVGVPLISAALSCFYAWKGVKKDVPGCSGSVPVYPYAVLSRSDFGGIPLSFLHPRALLSDMPA